MTKESERPLEIKFQHKLIGIAWWTTIILLGILVSMIQIFVCLPLSLVSKKLSYILSSYLIIIGTGTYLSYWVTHFAKLDFEFYGDVENSQGKLKRKEKVFYFFYLFFFLIFGLPFFFPPFFNPYL